MAKNVVSNYIPCERVLSDNRNLPWFSENVKQLIPEKNNMCKKYVKENKDLQYWGLPHQLSLWIRSSKQNYYSRWSSRLADLMTSRKRYWAILKMFLNKQAM